jgi:hypothetical protein
MILWDSIAAGFVRLLNAPPVFIAMLTDLPGWDFPE